MRYTGEQDEYILSLRETWGPQWKRIAQEMSRQFEEPFTDSCVRNRHQRIMKGEKFVNAGIAKNVCGKCGKFLLGHICKPPVCRFRFTPTLAKSTNWIQAASNNEMEAQTSPSSNIIRKEGKRVSTMPVDPEYVYGDKWSETEQEEEDNEVTLFSQFVFGL